MQLKYRCKNEFMIRTAASSIDAFLELQKENDISLDFFTNNEYVNYDFEEALLIASQALYSGIKRKPASQKKINNLKYSLLKYYIRACSRPTPFGLFSGVSMGQFDSLDNVSISSKKFIREINVDSLWLSKVIHLLEQDLNILKYLEVKFNSNCYLSGKRLYNAVYTNHGENEFSLSTDMKNIRYTDLVSLIQINASDFIPYNKLKDIIKDNYPTVYDKYIDKTILDLCENEYLYTNLRVPTYCQDYLKHVIEVLKTLPTQLDVYKKLVKIHTHMDNYQYNSSTDKIQNIKEIYNLMEQIVPSKNYICVNRGSTFFHACIKKEVKKKLEQFANTLSYIAIPSGTASRLSLFKSKFQEYFGYDIEVGFKDIIDINGFNGLQYISDIQTTANQQERYIKSIIEEQILFALMHGHKAVTFTLKDFTKDSFPFNHKPTFSFDLNFLLAESTDERGETKYEITLAPNGGAANAGSTIQRFEHILPPEYLKKYNELYSEVSQVSASHYALVEIREMLSAGRMGNLVNRSKHFEYVIPICSELSESRSNCGILSIYDLRIGLTRSNELYIYSDSLKKRVKIVTDNMVNTTLNLPIVQLLKAISDEYEDIPISRPFNLYTNKYIYTPRIYIEDVLVSPQKWNFYPNEFQLKTYETFKKTFLKFVDDYSVDQTIYVYQNDNRLLLNCRSEWGLRLLYLQARQNFMLKLGEVPAGVLNNSLVHDEKNRRYVSEFTFSFLLNNTNKESSILKTKTPDKENIINRSLQSKSRILFPGEQGWLYFKLYGNPINQNQILCNAIPQLLSLIKYNKFFFLRYADSDPHLRCRIKFDSETDLLTQLPTLYDWIKTLREKELINSITFDTYRRENNRYGGESLIDIIEEFFYYDSLLTIALLKDFNLNSEHYELVAYIIGFLSILFTFEDDFKEMNSTLALAVNTKTDKSASIHNNKEKLNEIAFCLLNNEIEKIDDRLANYLNVFHRRNKILIQIKEHYKQLTTLSTSESDLLLSLMHMFSNRLTGNKKLERKYLQIVKQIITMLMHTRES